MSRSRILVVDDEMSIRIMLSRMIEPLQHEVYTAEDGVAAYEMIRRIGFDLIVSDLNMPRMDGLTLLEKIRGDGNDAAFIILTGYGDLPQALAARERFNIANFLVKPIHNLDQFLFDIESAISRRRLEQENTALMNRLQEINVELEEKVRQRTRELEEKNRELYALSSFRADVLKVLGHELRTPLAILHGYYHLALAGGEGQLEALSPQISAAIDRLREIVEKALHQLQHSGQVRFPLELAAVRPEALCREVIERIQPFVRGRGLRIELAAADGVGECRWDAEKVAGLVEELLINAVRASPDGAPITVRVSAEGDEVLLAVEDRGVGVPGDQTERIFEPFVVLGEPNRHMSGQFEHGAQGIGIGLPTARIWAELHAGDITAQPHADGPGTTLRVRLPRNAGSARAAPEQDEPPREAPAG